MSFQTIFVVSSLSIIIGILIGKITQKKDNTINLLGEIVQTLLQTVDFNEAVTKIVNLMLTDLGYIRNGYQIIVLSLLDHDKQHLHRIAISQTEKARQFLLESPIPFKDIIIPLSAEDNVMVKVIKERKVKVTENVSDVLEPALDSEWVKKYQKQLGIKTTIVYPIIAKDKPLGVLIFSLSKNKHKISQQEWTILETFSRVVSVALDDVMLFKSITDTAKKLQYANERLQQLDQLKDEFVSLASHELRTPMTAIKSYIWLFLQSKDIKLTDKQKTYIERAYQSTDRLINLVNDMLNVSRIESGRLNILMKSTNMKNLVSEVIEELQPTAQKQNVNLVFQSTNTQIPNAIADQNKIREVLINLIGNSLKFTPENGKIEVLLSYENDLVKIKVTDSGTGIKQEDMNKLFHKFQTVGNNYLTKVNSQGTGLGLYLSKSIVELHGGKIWAESDGEGKGTTFTFTLKSDNNHIKPQLVSAQLIQTSEIPENQQSLQVN